MKRPICFLIAAVMSSALLAGCGESDSSSKHPSLLDEINNSSQTEDTGGGTSGRSTSYEWVLSPTIEAENIIAPDGAQVNTEGIENNAYMRVAILKRDGMYGFIDYNGVIMVKPEYSDYYIDYDGKMTLSRVTSEGTEYCAIDESGYITHVGTDRAIKDRFFFYDDAKQQCYYQNYKDKFAKPYNGKKMVAVQSINATDKGNDKFEVEIIDERFALCQNNELLTEYEYDDAYLPIYKGTGSTCIALCKDGKWGYVNGKGEQIIDFICDAIPQSSLASDLQVSEGLHPYLFAGKYIAVSVNSRFGYYNKKGEVIVTPGEFEQARPVLNGLAWVRKDGKWGVVQIGEIDESLVITTTTTTTTKKVETTKYTGTWATTTTTAAETTTETEKTEKTKKTKKTKETEPPAPTETETPAPTETEPPAPTETEPPQTEAPVTDPPATDPPATDPPAEQPAEQAAEQ